MASVTVKKIIYPREFFIHLLSWIIVFVSPLLFVNHDAGINWVKYFHGSMIPMSLCFIFYCEYLFIVPKYLIKGKRRNYIIASIVLIVGMLIALHLIIEIFYSPMPLDEMRRKNICLPPRNLFIIKDFFTFLFSAGLGTAIRLSMQWIKAEAARKEAELGRTDAELKNLRNQINPHFLLNTLNNIYALTAFNQEKAQVAIQELSKLLRYILYENQETYGSIQKEVEFLRTYIELMKIRIPRNVDIQVSFDVPENCSVQIAPLLFISLIENAFKHGISSIEQSYIYIALCVNEEKDVICKIENSYFPKTANDKSGSGIGLKQVQCRLDLLYSNNYSWDRGVSEDQSRYTSLLTIHTNKLL